MICEKDHTRIDFNGQVCPLCLWGVNFNNWCAEGHSLILFAQRTKCPICNDPILECWEKIKTILKRQNTNKLPYLVERAKLFVKLYETIQEKYPDAIVYFTNNVTELHVDVVTYK